MDTKRFAFKLLPICMALASTTGAIQAANIADFTMTNTLDQAYADYANDLQLELLSCDPALNTVRAAHGNTDWHIDTAHEFLFGEEMDGTPSAANHTPATWTRQHIHVDMTDTGDFYNDDTVTAFGRDTDIDNGIDKTMLFFYAGHGSPTSWSTLGDHGSQDDMLLGNCGNSSKLRYYWQCSCEVFAHGPEVCSGSSFDYACPQDHDGSSDSHSMRNVYERWGPALDSRLRMACGASTSAYCHEDQTNRIWDNYNNKGYDVADSFIFGLHSSSGYDSDVVPLCITTGGYFASGTPLYDTTFTNTANPSGSYYHIQYLSSFDTTAPVFVLPEIPRMIQRIRLLPPDPPPFLKDEPLFVEGDYLVSETLTEAGRPHVRIDTRSGALYLSEDYERLSSDKILSEQEYVERARSLLEEMELSENDMGEPEVIRVMIQTVPREGASKEFRESQKSVMVTFPRSIQSGENAVNVLGEGSKINVQLSNEGALMSLNKVWRRAVPEKSEPVAVKPYEKAYEEALKELGNLDRYKLLKTEFGYKTESGNVSQEEVNLVYRFVFHPEDDLKEELPPRMVEVSAI